MEVVQIILQTLLWVLCPLLILLILVQGGTGDVSSTFGGGGQLDSTLGVGASKKMGKITFVLSTVFLIGVLIIAIPAEQSVGQGAAGLGLETATPAPEAPAAIDPAPLQPAIDVTPVAPEQSAVDVEAAPEQPADAASQSSRKPHQRSLMRLLSKPQRLLLTSQLQPKRRRPPLGRLQHLNL